MIRTALSGQFLYFSMVSSISGFAVTGISGQISGRKAVDGGSMALLSGNVVEDAGGMYHANLYDWDTSGFNIGYLFTASGCVPVCYSVVTHRLFSGHIYTASGTANFYSGQYYTASGINVTVPVASLSGVVVNSGLNVTVPIASISGVSAASGAFVTSLPLSGQVYLASGSVTSGVISSGIFVNATASPPASGTTFLASGTALFYSGYYYPASGMTFIASGPNVVVPPSTLSGVVVNSGLNVIVPTASISGVVANSGLNVTVPITTISGTTVTANVTLWQGVAPNALIASGRLDAAFNVRTGVARSGTSTTIQLDAGVTTGISGVYDNAVITIVGGTGTGRSRVVQNISASGIATVFPAWDASGAPDNTSIFTITPGGFTFSGLVYPASGANTVVPPATLSGVIANSGLNVTVPISTVSGLNAVVPTASLSGVVANSGLNATVPIATISGVNAASGAFVTSLPLSGQAYLASGSLFKTTYASGVLAVEIPYGILKTDMSGVTGEAARSPQNAIRKLINKWDAGVTSSGVLTVFKEDDATTAYTQNMTAVSGAAAVTSLKTN